MQVGGCVDIPGIADDTVAGMNDYCPTCGQTTEIPSKRRIGVARRIALYLRTQPIGTVFTKEDLRQALGGNRDENLGRRMRDLRTLGWVIDTYREEPALRPTQHRLKAYSAVPGDESEGQS
jgi:hypothetical protein